MKSVILESGLEVATTPVTRRQWIEVMGQNTDAQRLWEAEYWGNTSLDCPATHVSARDAEEFCRRLGDGWRLPTVEEQAEYCLPLPSNFPLEQHAVYDQPYQYGPPPVASKEPMANGLYDTHGLVYEWAIEEVMSKLIQYWLRGGSWSLLGDVCRSANRIYYSPVTRLDYYGFRVVRGGGNK